jgi:hypothetical protein
MFESLVDEFGWNTIILVGGIFVAVMVYLLATARK